MADKPRLTRPPALVEGDVIGVAAPAGPFPSERFETGLARLESMGFYTVTPPQIYERTGFTAGPDHRRADLFNSFLHEKNTRAVMAARGGYGSMRILDRLEPKALATDPKIIIGFSDVTALLLHLVKTAGVVTFHGPVVTSLTEADSRTMAHLKNFLTGRPVFPLSLDDGWIIRGGQARGPLLGGNLTMITHLLPTGRLPDLDGAILFLEDTNEAPYRLDRMLTTLRLSGVLDKVRGVLLGQFVNCGPEEEVWSVLYRTFDRFPGPVAANFPVGHGPGNLALPLGPEAVLDTELGILDLAEPYLA